MGSTDQKPAANFLGNSTTHGIYRALPDDIVIQEPEIYTTRLKGDDTADLSPDEIAHFKDQGFIVKRGLVDERSELRDLIDYIWEHIPQNVMERNDPASWSNGPEDRLDAEDGARLGPFSNSAWKIRSPEQFGTEPALLKLTAQHPGILAVVRQFIGGAVRPSNRARGVYAIFPKPAERHTRLGVHADIVSSHVTAMVLLADVPPRSGGFTIWPGTHHALHPFWNTEHGSQMDDASKIDAFIEARDRLVRETVPVECSGKAGDVVFWHPRLLHSAGINHSVANSPIVRFVAPCDFQRDGSSCFDDDIFGPGKTHQWWIDTRNYREDEPPGEDIWRDWAI